jgi:hypothetical protein
MVDPVRCRDGRRRLSSIRMVSLWTDQDASRDRRSVIIASLRARTRTTDRSPSPLVPSLQQAHHGEEIQ